MAGSNLSDPKNNDLARSCPPYDFGDSTASEVHSDIPRPGVGGQDNSHATPEAKRAGYGYSYIGPSDHGLGDDKPNGRDNGKVPGRAATGGHNLGADGQYSIKMTRGSSL
jgi:hypothetical protein